MNQEKRKYTRLPININTELVTHDGEVHSCTSENLSFGGAMLKLPENSRLKIGDTCEVSLVLQEQPQRLAIRFQCKVVNSRNNTLNLQFTGVFAENYKDFVYLMVNESDNPEVLMEEMSRNPGYEISTIKI